MKLIKSVLLTDALFEIVINANVQYNNDFVFISEPIQKKNSVINKF